jgi:hypothetical protein
MKLSLGMGHPRSGGERKERQGLHGWGTRPGTPSPLLENHIDSKGVREGRPLRLTYNVTERRFAPTAHRSPARPLPPPPVVGQNPERIGVSGGFAYRFGGPQRWFGSLRRVAFGLSKGYLFVVGTGPVWRGGVRCWPRLFVPASIVSGVSSCPFGSRVDVEPAGARFPEPDVA